MNNKNKYYLKSNQKFKFSIFLILSLLFYQNIYSQFTWQRLYNGPFNQQDICVDMSPAPNGNFFAVGYSKKPTTQGYFIYVLKLNPYGDTIWTRIIDSVSNETYSCAESGDGGVVIVGEGHFALKLDSAGNIAWKRFYNRGGIVCYDIIKTSDGGFLACGEQLVVFGSAFFRYDSYVMKLDFNGNILWDTAYLAIFDKPLKSVVEVSGVGYIYTGYVRNFIPDTVKCLIFKTDYSGNIIWEKNLKIFNRNAGGTKIEKMTNGFIICGGTPDTTLSIGRTFILKIDNLGNIISTRYLNSNIREVLTDFKIINSNRYAMTTYNNIAKSILSDSLGNIIVQKSYSTQYYTYLFSILLLSNGDIIWGGGARFTVEDADVWIIRSDSLLNFPPIGIQPNANNLPSKYGLFQNYPNPFNPVTKIKFSISLRANVKIVVYNLLGEIINILIEKEMNSGEHEVSFYGENLSSGIYFYQLIVNDNIIDTKKMCLLK